MSVSPRPCATKHRFGLRLGPVWPLALCPDSGVLRTPFSKNHSGLAPVWSGLAHLTAGSKRFECVFTHFHCRATPAPRAEAASQGLKRPSGAVSHKSRRESCGIPALPQRRRRRAGARGGGLRLREKARAGLGCASRRRKGLHANRLRARGFGEMLPRLISLGRVFSEPLVEDEPPRGKLNFAPAAPASMLSKSRGPKHPGHAQHCGGGSGGRS